MIVENLNGRRWVYCVTAIFQNKDFKNKLIAMRDTIQDEFYMNLSQDSSKPNFIIIK